jgi:CheY-like chemotaxis protein
MPRAIECAIGSASEKLRSGLEIFRMFVAGDLVFSAITENLYLGMGLAITIERLWLASLESTIKPNALCCHPKPDGLSPVGRRCHACPVAVAEKPSMSRMATRSSPRFGSGWIHLRRVLVILHAAGLSSVVTPFLAVIDDDEALCESLVDLMRSVGYRAEPFLSAENFLMFADRFTLDCIIADVHMPGMGGIELLRALHEQSIMTPVILITALPDKHLDEEAASKGALCLLRKPFKTGSLLEWIERSLLQ